MNQLVIFADYGLDDALATVRIWRKRHRFDQLFFVPIGGNVPTAQAHRNCITLLNLLREKGEAVTVCDTRAIAQPCEYLDTIHGTDGMGDAFPACEDTAGMQFLSFDALMALPDDRLTILSLGPCTLVAPFLAAHPKAELVLMGGCIDTPPNYGEYEFNQGINPAAFAACTAHAHLAVTLDTCRIDAFDMRKQELGAPGIYRSFLEADVRLSLSRREEGCFVWDDVAAMVLLSPEHFTFEDKTDRQGNRLRVARYRLTCPLLD